MAFALWEGDRRVVKKGERRLANSRDAAWENSVVTMPLCELMLWALIDLDDRKRAAGNEDYNIPDGRRSEVCCD